MLARLAQLPSGIKQYLLITTNYWAFTLTDGALRMLVVLHFYQLGFDALSIAMLFLFYEFFGVLTNLFGGWLGARFGLNKTMNIGLALQVFALFMLLFMSQLPSQTWVMIWVMAAQALSGIAKDLNKMSAKSSIKLLLPKNAEGTDSRLYKWVALLTGSKNALKGVGFFLGALFLSVFGFDGAVWAMLILLVATLLLSLRFLKKELGKSTFKPKFSQLFAKNSAINYLSAARLFLFAARDVWFVVALPVFMSQVLGWSHWQVGAFMAIWIIFYGCVQAFTPKLTSNNVHTPNGRSAVLWALVLAASPLLIALLLFSEVSVLLQILAIVIGLLVFGFLFAINSSLHSFLIVHFASEDGISLDIGFYYMANAMGRLLGTVLSGAVFVYIQGLYSAAYALAACLTVSFVFIVIAAGLSLALPRKN